MTEASTPIIERSSAVMPTVLRSNATLPATITSSGTVGPTLRADASMPVVMRSVAANGVGATITAPARITVTAGEVVSALKPVVVLDGEGFVARSGTSAHCGFLAGIAATAATSGNNLTVRTSGEMTDSAWNWDTSLPYLFVADGVLTQTPPTSGWLQSVARVESSDTIFIEIGEPITLI